MGSDEKELPQLKENCVKSAIMSPFNHLAEFFLSRGGESKACPGPLK